MGFKQLELKLATGFTPEELKEKIAKKLKIRTFSYTIEKQSLDARKKGNIHWNLKVGVTSASLRGTKPRPREAFQIPFKKRDRQVVVTGSGPAGFFAAYALLRAGFGVTLLEQGRDVDTRLKDITAFERTGDLDESSNYAFGEGGAGTFSDGKLTSRTKTIAKERVFIFDTFIKHGAPEEIAYLAHPHLGSDNLRKIARAMRRDFEARGGRFLFETKVTDLHVKDGKVRAVETTAGKLEADFFIFAAGHSSYETYRMLMRRGAPFRVKPFALGCRVEHPQALINEAQWGNVCLTGVKAAEYRLTSKEPDRLPVYSFCMCPGGRVAPAAAYKNTNIVNGMSNYLRNSPFANAAIVAGVRLDELLDKEPDPLEALEWLQRLEETFFDFSGSYTAPACKIDDFLAGRVSGSLDKSSYPFGLTPADFRDLLPQPVADALKAGMADFVRKLRGFEQGVMLGLESKTSSPVQAVREKTGRCAALKNLYISGEGSGFAGGIVSSAADGIKAAVDIISSS